MTRGGSGGLPFFPIGLSPIALTPVSLALFTRVAARMVAKPPLAAHFIGVLQTMSSPPLGRAATRSGTPTDPPRIFRQGAGRSVPCQAQRDPRFPGRPARRRSHPGACRPDARCRAGSVMRVVASYSHGFRKVDPSQPSRGQRTGLALRGAPSLGGGAERQPGSPAVATERGYRRERTRAADFLR